MRRVLTLLLVCGTLLALPLAAFADNMTSNGAVHLMIGQMITTGFICAFNINTCNTQGQVPIVRWFDFQPRDGRSYCVEATAGDGVNAMDPKVTVFASDATTVLATNDTTGQEPYANLQARACFIGSLSNGVTQFIKVEPGSTNPGIQAQVLLRLVETTLYCNWFFIGGDYNAFTEIRNTSDQTLSLSMTFRDLNAVVRGTTGPTIAGNGGALVNARDFVTGTTTGTLEIAHVGSPDAIVASTTTLSNTTGLSFDNPCVQRRPW
jgi:hypothetical protein